MWLSFHICILYPGRSNRAVWILARDKSLQWLSEKGVCMAERFEQQSDFSNSHQIRRTVFTCMWALRLYSENGSNLIFSQYEPDIKCTATIFFVFFLLGELKGGGGGWQPLSWAWRGNWWVNPVGQIISFKRIMRLRFSHFWGCGLTHKSVLCHAHWRPFIWCVNTVCP